ncbi:cupin domain-containing protein [Saccharothrix obliqua]|uniref:cupin domain-containing protein n=1 Tax=Saccharothrix obliqua TaxID=2861747 RepID=UPI001C5FAE00|nr:cupin domain-containing protein [Saccharothrix obliqua]MBW4722183.1 cupin domain-containing protein [Saccharothrix obliqua]
MIVTSAAGLSRAADDHAWRCLARRGMLHSECEAVDYLRLPPGATRDGRGRDGVDVVWFVLSGQGRFSDGNRSVELNPGDLLLSTGGSRGKLHSAAAPLELLSLTVLPTAVTERLPARVPVASWLLGGGHG